jgi:hypothetical protein
MVASAPPSVGPAEGELPPQLASASAWQQIAARRQILTSI